MFKFAKYHGLGNDYIVIDPNLNEISLEKQKIIDICNRNIGVGSDGILYGPELKNGQIHFKIFNPDGSEAEKSGNGIRIFAQYLLDNKYVTEDTFELYTISGKVKIEVVDKKNNILKVNMGRFNFNTKEIPVNLDTENVILFRKKFLDKDFEINCVSVGNPHCVIIMNEEVSPEIACKYGSIIENDPMFPNRINVQFVNIIDRHNAKIEIWERGAGYTLASGTSSCAVASVLYKLGFVDDEITIHMRGGEFTIKIKDGEIYLTGETKYVMSGVCVL